MRRCCSGRIPHAFNVGEEEQTVCTKTDRTRDRHLIRVYVVDPAGAVSGHTGDHGHVIVPAQQRQQFRVRTHGPPYGSEVGVHGLRFRQSGIDAR